VRRFAGLLIIGLVGLVLPPRAEAAPEDFASPLHFAVELHYSPIKFSSYFIDPVTGLAAAPSQSAAGFWAEWMPITQWGKLGVGLGYQYIFDRVAVYSSGDSAKVLAHAAEVGLTYRLDYLRNQYVVPYGRFAVALLFPRLVQTLSGTETKANLASQKGTELAFGAEVLLDWLEPRSAANLDREQGINNLFLFAEYTIFDSPSGASADLSYRALRAGFRAEF
jgi:hypothetical protein